MYSYKMLPCFKSIIGVTSPAAGVWSSRKSRGSATLISDGRKFIATALAQSRKEFGEESA
jgi:hypothetical protein